MTQIDLARYTVLNAHREFLADEDLLLLPVWTTDPRQMWVTGSQLEAQKVAHQVHGVACALQAQPLAVDPRAASHRGVPVAVQRQVVTLREQGLSYRRIAALLNIAKSTVGNILNRV